MAFRAEPVGADALAYTIHIWPSSGLIAQSWHWPACWREAFERAAGLLGLAAAICVLDGRSFSERQFELPISVGCVEFNITRRGKSILITISDFTGPDSSGPDSPGPKGGGHPQPRSIDGLVLGLRGWGRYYRLVVFHGFMPSIPAINILPFELPIVFSETYCLRVVMQGRRLLNNRVSDPGFTIGRLDLIPNGQDTGNVPIIAAVRDQFRGNARFYGPKSMLPAPEWETYGGRLIGGEIVQREIRELFNQLSQIQKHHCNSSWRFAFCLQIWPLQTNQPGGRYLH